MDVGVESVRSIRMNGTGDTAGTWKVLMNGALVAAVIGHAGIIRLTFLFMIGIVIPPTLLLIGMLIVQLAPHAGHETLMGVGDVPSVRSTARVDPATMSCEAVIVAV